MGTILKTFKQLTGTMWQPDQKQAEVCAAIETSLPTLGLSKPQEDTLLDSTIKTKLGIVDSLYKNLIDACALKKITFNSHEKILIKTYINWSKYDDLLALTLRRLPGDEAFLRKLVNTIETEANSIDYKVLLRSFLQKHDSNFNDILQSIFAQFFFYHFDENAILTAINESSHPQLSYYNYLRKEYPDLFEREQAAYLLELKTVDEKDFDNYREWALSQIKAAYDNLNNHCYLFVSIEGENKGQLWDLYRDVMLYAEKFIDTDLPKTFFKPDKIAKDTAAYIKELNDTEVEFSTAQIGFSYEDCFILANSDHQTYNKILLSFIKNSFDETKIPCPRCRSKNVRANSYPKLGVRSWECANPICPDRSVFNRGKRYNFYSILRQEAIHNPNNLITRSHINKWKFDISYSNKNNVYQLIAKHYSLHGEKITIINNEVVAQEFSVSQRRFHTIKELSPNNVSYVDFVTSSFFKRYIVEKDVGDVKMPRNLSGYEQVQVFAGDAYPLLAHIDTASLDGAVTSPPYYNAREYSTWNNIYSYLYDMYNIYKELYRTLKPGALFVFNIFDYFDNDKTIVYSNMGKKRIMLGAYSLDIFRRIGFIVRENLIWDKGEVEGKRFFNQGNDFPYYQKPFNSWEHIFILQKPPAKGQPIYPQILREKPVLKMLKGKNTLGHTAPYPKAIPEILTRTIKSGTIIDPFSGSMTSGRVAYEHGLGSINIDLSVEYCELGIQLWKRER